MNAIRHVSLRGVFACAMLVCAPAAWADADPLIEGARQCTQRFPLEEKSNQIPTHLLAAIATTESGRWHEGLGMNVPWPWTINVEGKGYYFKSKAEAIAQTRQLLAQGRQSIDVGCMQVNLKHHPKAFATLEDAFDPEKNVNYAARFLRENYASLGDWIKATAAYHSRTPQYGARYLGEIERSWNRIVSKVAAAREGKAGDSKKTALKNPVVPQQTRIVSSSNRAGAVAAAPVVAEQKATRPSAHARVIQVKDAMAARREAPVMVVRAAPATPVAVAETAPAAAPTTAATAPEGNTIRQVNLDSRVASGLAQPQASTPKFVFAN